jgi:DNA-binding beta-propeller fold protein YncE
MMIYRNKILLCIFTVVVVALTGVSSAQAEEGPVKLILSSRIGEEVNRTTGGKICTIASKDECQEGKPSSEPAGFEYPESVAVAPNGNIYVADQANHRVQELTATGEFVLMFGEEVNETTHGDICTEEEIKSSAVKCTKGASGVGSGAFAEPQGVVVDPITGNIYVQDFANWRVDEYTSTGEFILMVGKEVNEKGITEAEKNLCTAVSKDTCRAGVRGASDSLEKSSFDFTQFVGNLLAIGGGPEHRLFVGDHHRIQEFNSQGEWKAEVKLTSAIMSSEPDGSVTAIAIDEKTEVLYVVYNTEPVVHEFSATTGEELEPSITISAREASAPAFIRALAVDSSGHVAVSAVEEVVGREKEQFGSLYKASNERVITGFTIPTALSGISGIGFNGKDELYIVVAASHEVLSYAPVSVAEVVTGNATCKVGAEVETSNRFDCVLNGEVNPYNVINTQTWFEWGNTCASLSFETEKKPVVTAELLIPVNDTIIGLRPDEEFCYELAGQDQNVQSPEQVAGDALSFETPAVAPKIVGEPAASFVTSSSAVMNAELNPENSPTEYYFEYAPESNPADKILAACENDRKENCPGVAITTAGESTVYGKTGLTLEAKNLQPATLYHYRLSANSLDKTKAELRALGLEGSFETPLASKVEAFTGVSSSVTTSSAFVEGAVNPDGQQAIYMFELGIYQGADTKYSVVLSGSTGVSLTAESKAVTLTGLQPGTIYAYRIAIHSGYGTAEGALQTFTTSSIPILAPLVAPPQLSVPKIDFPRSVPTCKQGYKLDKHNKCVKTKKKTKVEKHSTKQKHKKKSKKK